MNSPHPIPNDFLPANEPELDALWQSWNRGDLSMHATLLLGFAARRREEILRLAAEGGGADPILAMKRLVVCEGTVDHGREMRDQQREIHNDIWFHGQRGDLDRRRISREWVGKYGPGWRRWRIKEYLFVIDRIAGRLTEILAETEALRPDS